MFKSFIPALVIASAIAAPVLAQAQEAGLTRAQVKAELAQMQQGGYSPSSDHATYPVETQAAEQRAVSSGVVETAYGTSTSGTSATGSRMIVGQSNAARSTYFGQ